jgi:hypothetical protein
MLHQPHRTEQHVVDQQAPLERVEFPRGRDDAPCPLPVGDRTCRLWAEHAVVADAEQALHLGHVRAAHVRRRKPQGSRLLGVHLTAVEMISPP